MKKIGQIILWVVLFCLLVILSWAVALALDWPAWGGLVIFLGVVGLYYAIKLIRRLWVVSRSRAKLAQSEIQISNEGRGVRDALNTLGKQWKSGLNLLRHSTLRKYGNPVYALPWYLVLGAKDSGKTSMLGHADLASLINNRDTDAPVEPTETMDWWFFNNAVLIDTAGRFVDPNATESDRQEWNKLLDLMSRSRFWETLNGLVLTVDAGFLLNNDIARIEAYARVLRERIDQLIRLFDARFPIYVVLTKCDQIEGFTRWAATLDDAEKGQALGYIGDEGDGEGVEQVFLDRALLCLQDRLRQSRLNLAMRRVELDSGLLLLVAEIEKLRPGLKTFFETCFGNSAYLEQPFLRGLYLTSAASVSSCTLQSAVPPASPTQAAGRGLFLQDLFSKILPHDRYLKRRTLLVNRWRVLTRNIAMLAWVTLIGAACVFVVVSYVQTRNAFSRLEAAFPNEQVLTSHQTDDEVVVVLAMKNVVDLLLNERNDFLTGWLVFGPKIIHLENDIKSNYVTRVRELLGNHEQSINKYENALNSNNPSLQADAVILLARQINLVQARLNGATYNKLKTYPELPTAEAIRIQSFLANAMQDNFGLMYTAYIAWSPTNDDALRLYMLEKRTALTNFVVNTHQPDWLLDWADLQPGVNGVDLKDFWSPMSAATNTVKVRGAFTQAGSDRITALLEEIRLAMNDSMEYQAKRAIFDRWYKSERFNAWQTFSWAFPQGESLLQTEPEWRDMLTRINSNSSPYFRLIDRLRAEFETVPADQLPDWLVFVRDFKSYTAAKPATTTTSKMGLFLTAINRVGGEAIRNSLASGSMLLPGDVKKTMASIDAYRKYRADLDVAIAGALGGEDSSLKMASAFFSNVTDSKTDGASLPFAYNSFLAFKKTSLYNFPEDQMVWNLLAGPLHMLVRYTDEQASCMLQKNWEKSVVWRTQLAVSAKELSQQLYGTEGSVWAFIDGTAKPFVLQQANGFAAAKVNEFVFPFTPEFIPYLNRSISNRVEQIVREQRADALKGKTAKLTVTSRPISVNVGAKAKPYAVLFGLQCTTGEVLLNNYNTAATDTISWSPEICGDVTLQIKIDNITLTRRYPGSFGLIKFIEEFQDGERRFTPLDFPGVKTKLDALGVKTIGVRYEFSGLDAVVQLGEDLNYVPDAQTPATARPFLARKQVPIPQIISQCWRSGNPEALTSSVSSLIQRKAQEILQEQSKPAAKPELAPAPVKAPQTKAITKTKSHANQPKIQLMKVQPSVPESRFYIQVGVYNSELNIKSVQKQLNKLGMKMVLESMNGDLAGSQRLLVGPYDTKEDAAKALNRLTMLGMGGLVVKRTP